MRRQIRGGEDVKVARKAQVQRVHELLKEYDAARHGLEARIKQHDEAVAAQAERDAQAAT